MTSRLEQLQIAAAEYGQESIRICKLAQKCGETILLGFASYLGACSSDVFGVPPEGDWGHRLGDYGDASFSFYYEDLLEVKAVDMGLAVRIPNRADEGALWIRVTINIGVEGDQYVIGVGDSPIIRVSLDITPNELMSVFEKLFNELLSIFADPVRRTSATQMNRIGFQLECPDTRR